MQWATPGLLKIRKKGGTVHYLHCTKLASVQNIACWCIRPQPQKIVKPGVAAYSEAVSLYADSQPPYGNFSLYKIHNIVNPHLTMAKLVFDIINY